MTECVQKDERMIDSRGGDGERGERRREMKWRTKEVEEVTGSKAKSKKKRGMARVEEREGERWSEQGEKERTRDKGSKRG